MWHKTSFVLLCPFCKLSKDVTFDLWHSEDFILKRNFTVLRLWLQTQDLQISPQLQFGFTYLLCRTTWFTHVNKNGPAFFVKSRLGPTSDGSTAVKWGRYRFMQSTVSQRLQLKSLVWKIANNKTSVLFCNLWVQITQIKTLISN